MDILIFLLYRKSKVTLVCDANRADHSLEFLGELVTTEYVSKICAPYNNAFCPFYTLFCSTVFTVYVDLLDMKLSFV